MIYRGLLSYGKDGLLRGELAESWAPEGQEAWVFKLRDATFHNGEKVTSADVKWTIAQIAAKKSTAFFRKEMRSEEHTSELQSLMRISYAVSCLKKKKTSIKTKLNK